MSRIRSRGNKATELALVRLLRAHKIRGWRRQVRVAVDGSKLMVDGRKRSGSRHQPSTLNHRLTVLTVRPDFVFPKSRTAVFVDGCFWHGCPKHATKPKSNAAFWRKKFAANKARDRRVNRMLRAAGWQVLRVWEHELRRSRKQKVESGKTKSSTSHPSPVDQLPGGGTGPTICRPDPPTRRARSEERGTPAVIRRIQRALELRLAAGV